VAPAGVTVLSGVLNCRNFTVPAGAIIEVDRTLTVRASGVTQIAGTIRTRNNPVIFEPNVALVLALDHGLTTNTFGTNQVNAAGVPVTNRAKASNYAGYCSFSLGASTSIVGRGTQAGFNIVPSSVTINSGTPGAILTINSAGPVTLSGTALINCSASSSLDPVIQSSVTAMAAYGGTPTENWNTAVVMLPPSPTAGTFVLQSATSIVIAAGANISANAANGVAGKSYTQSIVSGGTLQTVNTNWFSVGGGGGGAIHFQAPTVSSSPSAVITSNAGSTPSGLLVNGPGSGGNGYIASTNTPAQPGPITTVIAAPIEF
jgi:hypothetical protein